MLQTLSDPEKRAAYDSIAGFQVGGINPFKDTSYERDMVFVDEFTCIGKPTGMHAEAGRLSRRIQGVDERPSSCVLFRHQQTPARHADRCAALLTIFVLATLTSPHRCIRHGCDTGAGCKNCANVCSNTFFMEDEWGRARVRQQGVAGVEKLQEDIDCCPVSCIHWVSWELRAEQCWWS